MNSGKQEAMQAYCRLCNAAAGEGQTGASDENVYMEINFVLRLCNQNIIYV